MHRAVPAGVVAPACLQDGRRGNTGSPVGGVPAPTGTPRGAGRAGRVADRPAVLKTPDNAGRGKAPDYENGMERKQGMTTGQHLAGSRKVRKLQTMLHAKAKEEPDWRFHALADKVWRTDFLTEAWIRVRRNGGSAGVDGERFEDIEARGVERWLGELSRDLREGTYAPKPVRQVLIPKKQPGKLRTLGIPCLRDRVAQTSAMLVLEPIFEADLQPEQYACGSWTSFRSWMLSAASSTGGAPSTCLRACRRNAQGVVSILPSLWRSNSINPLVCTIAQIFRSTAV